MPSAQDTRPTVVVLTTRWGRRLGGINSFSTDLCKALAEIAEGARVVCVALSADESDRVDAAAANVALLSLDLETDSAADQRWASHVFGVLLAGAVGAVEHWIGHDAITGELAVCCARESGQGRATVLMHMSYADYLFAKHAAAEGTTIAERSAKQKSVLQSADFACAVGPLLFERLCDIRGSDHSVAELVPGLPEGIVAHPPFARLQAIGLGRFTADAALVKQAPLAAAAFGRAVRIGSELRDKALMSAQLTLIGVPPIDADHLRNLAETEAGRVVNIQTVDFLDSRERLLGLLSESNACLLLSWHEGFGLTAWEAIGAGVPIILSQNSGVFSLLESLGGPATGCVTTIDVRGRSDGAPQEEDIESVKKALLAVTRNIPASLANAHSLRNLLRERGFTWERTARTLAELIDLSTAKPGVKSGAEAKPSEPTDIGRREAEAARRREIFARRIGYRPDPFFQGRKAEIDRLVQGLKERKSLQIRSVIWGMGGVGKTALAVQLCHQLIARDVFGDGILWYRVRQEGVAEVIKRCTIDLDIDPAINAVTDTDVRVAAFQHTLRKLDLLVVLDNADYGPEVMRPIFDLFRGVPLLITSRREFDLPDSIQIPLGDLRPKEAVALVSDLLGMSGEAQGPAGSLGSLADIEELCQAVSCLPIALVLATAHIRERRLPIRRYIAAWRSRRDRLRLLAAARIDVKEEKLRDVRACFGISYDDLDERARRILGYMGLWEGRDFSLAHLASVTDEIIYPDVDGHDGAVTVACELPGGGLGVTGGEDGRVLVWDLSGRRRPRVVLTVFQAADPIADLVVGPDGRQFLIQTDTGLIAMAPSVDVTALRIARLSILTPQFEERVPLVIEDGQPLIEVREDRLRFRLRLEWPSLASPDKLADVRGSCEAMRESTDDGSSPSADPAWRREISHLWHPRGHARPGIEIRDRIASMVLGSAVKVPDLPEPRSAREDFLLERGEQREPFPRWKPIGDLDELDHGLAALSTLLQQRSLAEKLDPDDAARVHVHPLVSEFAAEDLSPEERYRAVAAMSQFYLDRIRSSRRHFDADEANIEFSFIWALQNWTSEQLIDDEVLREAADVLSYRGRYSLGLQWSETYVQAAWNGTDLQKGRALVWKALFLGLCGRMREWHECLIQSRELLERASCERPILSGELSDLWWSWCMHQNSMISLARCDASAKISMHLRQGRMVSCEPYFWSRVVAQGWADRGSRKTLALKEELFAGSEHNRRNRIEDFACEYGDVEDLLHAHGVLLSLNREEPAEGILYSAHELRLNAFLAEGNPTGAMDELGHLRQLSKGMPIEAKRSELLLYEAQIALCQGEHREACDLWEQSRLLLDTPAGGPPSQWFWEAYFYLADSRPEAATTALRESRRYWLNLSCWERCAYHRLAAWALATLNNEQQVRCAWARAEAYEERFALMPPWERKINRDLFALGATLRITPGEVAAAHASLWGVAKERPYVLVRAPDVQLQETPKGGAESEVLGRVEPLHLRNRAATVRELRDYCSATDSPLPWYYRVNRPEAEDSEWARFVPYSLALPLARHIDEDLPGTLNWGTLPNDPAWRLPIPPEATPAPQADSVEGWLEQSPAWRLLSDHLLRRGEIASSDFAFLRAVLCADPLSAVDKWRIVDAVLRAGGDNLPSRLRALAEIAAARSVTPLLAGGVVARMERDWRSIAYIAGLVDAMPDAVWLRPETRNPHARFGTLEHIGAIGAIALAGTPGPCLLVPDGCAWADVLVWPSRLFDPTWYCEEAPPWP